MPRIYITSGGTTTPVSDLIGGGKRTISSVCPCDSMSRMQKRKKKKTRNSNISYKLTNSILRKYRKKRKRKKRRQQKKISSKQR